MAMLRVEDGLRTLILLFNNGMKEGYYWRQVQVVRLQSSELDLVTGDELIASLHLLTSYQGKSHCPPAPTSLNNLDRNKPIKTLLTCVKHK